MPPAQQALNLLIWAVIFTVLDAIFIGLRFWAARIVRRDIYPDDYLLIFSFITTLALEGVMVWGIFNGMGRPSSTLTLEELRVQFQLIPATYVTWTLATTAFKLSVLFLYTRIMTRPMIKRLSYLLMGLSIAYCISFLAVFLTTCTPDISQLWNPRPDGQCRDLNIGQLGSVSTNLGLDILIIALPMPFLWGLQMQVRKKLVVTAAFSLGFITIAIMIWRIQLLVSAAHDPTSDFVHDLPILALTTTLELWLCIIIACIPTIGPVVRVYFKPILTKLSGHGNSEGSAPVHLNTFARGRFGGRSREQYNDVLASQDTGEEEPIVSTKPPLHQGSLGGIQKQTVTTSDVSFNRMPGQNLDLYTAEIKSHRRAEV